METISLAKETLLCFTGSDQTREQGFLVSLSEMHFEAGLLHQFSSTVSGNTDKM